MVALVKSERLEFCQLKLEELFDCWKAIVRDFVKIVLMLTEFHLFQIGASGQSAASLGCHPERTIADLKRLQGIATRIYQSRQSYLTHVIESN